MGKRRRGTDAAGQFLIEWNVDTVANTRDPVASSRTPLPEVPPLVQYLKWDFRETFPQPLPEAIDAGVLDETDLAPENVRMLHENFSRECLSALKALDAVLDTRRRGVDPATGKAPRTKAAAERLDRYFNEQPARLEGTFNLFIETYGNAFGDEAADAFTKALRARHAGIEVVADAEAVSRLAKEPAVIPDDAAQAAAARVREATPKLRARGLPVRFVARLPVPRPLPEAIKAGRFGHDEKGHPIRPAPDEVRAITESHAEKLIALLDAARHVAPPGQERCSADYEAGIHAYAEDFGHAAARQLEAYVHRQASPGEVRKHVVQRGR